MFENIHILQIFIWRKWHYFSRPKKTPKSPARAVSVATDTDIQYYTQTSIIAQDGEEELRAEIFSVAPSTIKVVCCFECVDGFVNLSYFTRILISCGL